MHQIWNALHNKQLLRQHSYINGKYVEGKYKYHIINPADGEKILEVSRIDKDQLKYLVDSSEEAFKKWKRVNTHERAKILRNWHSLIIKNIDDLSYILTVEQGKPLHESRTEIMYAASFVEWFAEEAKRTYGKEIPAKENNQEILTVKHPIGICLAITPWNFPAAMVTRKIAPALAAGCSVILKPSELTPIIALALTALAEDAGVPAGCFNVVLGEGREVIPDLILDQRIRKLSFTGSTQVGRVLAEKCAADLKKLSLELGGHAPMVIFPDADIDLAIEGIISSNFRNCGQTCIAPNRIIVHSSIQSKIIEKLVSRIVNEFNVGSGLDLNTTIGPLINEEAIDKVDYLVKDAINKGARLHLGGKPIDRNGFFYNPTVLSGLNHDMAIANQEIFGPVAAFYSFDEDSEAIEMANKSHYGLASYIYTKDVNRIWSFSSLLEYGMVGINETKISSEIAPFGGMKQSGYGKEGSYLGIEEYLQTKYLCWSY